MDAFTSRALYVALSLRLAGPPMTATFRSIREWELWRPSAVGLRWSVLLDRTTGEVVATFAAAHMMAS